MFLGLNGVVVKSHGGTDALGFAAAIGVAADLVRQAAPTRGSSTRCARVRPTAAAAGPGGRVLDRCVRSVVRGVGAYLPARVVTNAELSRAGSTPPTSWIRERTGIGQRHIAAEGELTSDLATAPPRRPRSSGPTSTRRRSTSILVATSTPDHTFPATATAVQRKLGMPRGIAFDLQAVCAGFVYALATADNFIRAGQARTALVIGAETFSRILDWEDRGTCVLFGDGAGAVVLRGRGAAGHARATAASSATYLCADGRPLQASLRRRRPVLDADHRPPADERPRGVPHAPWPSCRARR